MIAPPANEPKDWSREPVELRLALIRECRKIFGAEAAKELWTILDLPDPYREGPELVPGSE